MPSPNVLITAASRRVPLVQAFRRALHADGGGRVIVTDVNALSPAVYAGDRAYLAPLASDRSYLDEIFAIAHAERVGLIVPTIDDEMPLFASAADRFLEDGIRVAVSPESTTSICNDKYATCTALAAHGVAAAASYLPREIPSPAPLPLFIKPRFGRGSVGAFPVRNQRELDFFLTYVTTPVVQEFLDGPEFTIDMLCDFDGVPLAIVPRERVVIRAGVIDRGRTVKRASLLQLAEACAEALPFAGPVNLQCRIVGDRPVIFEINPRFSGGIPLTIEAGVDFASMLLRLARGQRVSPCIGRFRENLWMSNYESSVFLNEGQVRLEPLRRAGVAEVA